MIVRERPMIDDYMPPFDTEILTTTKVERHSTLHTEHVDWDNYPFGDPGHTKCLCCSDAGKLERLEKWKEYLRVCERCTEEGVEVLASDYGGWPRIWKKVVAVGMGSFWPYWTPRPVVVVEGTLGYEWIDWTSLTGAEAKTSE